MLRRVTDILFRQADAPARMRLTRTVLGAAALRTLWHLPDGSFFEEHADTVMSEQVCGKPRFTLTRQQYDLLRGAGLVGMALWTAGVRHPAVRTVAATAFISTNAYVAHFHPRFWNYNSHLSLFVGVAAAADLRPPLDDPLPERTAQLQSVALASMQLGAATVYSQAGLSKLVHGGREWMTTGRTVKGSLAVLGTPAGAELSRNDELMRLIAVLTVLGEAAFLPLLVARWQDRRLIGAGAVGFHLLTRRYLGISFWHMWWLHPALFVVPLVGDDRSASRAHRLGVALLKGFADQMCTLPAKPNGV
ncbi:hypothetical protein GXW83_06255 [Streptacidiphilus sp. PB12-B1b]|uniref:hypothetical protein n=1 Tax=Streptacidiphilus sp. PB12-B1b TaxID=2705012 RepID=UPI0015FC5DFF|nr:hypothetical protein [Streptacidiphilus sp. PB12-B1b]QMU75410.1 hypothetical protein GXW83_06255 [Streptacidiphilus sp. PB12-B1b]